MASWPSVGIHKHTPASAVEASTTSYFYLPLVFLYASKLYHSTNHWLSLTTSTEEKKFNRSTSWAKLFESLYLLHFLILKPILCMQLPVATLREKSVDIQAEINFLTTL